ncbi:MAG: glycosyltransferase family 2 protein [Rhodoluna sp.]
MTNPLVSVCIPCYNAAPYIGQAIDSIIAQTYPHIEIIVVNDGSTDNSGRVLEGYRSSRIKVINANFGSAAKSRNLAFSMSHGHWIKFFDADDLLNTEAIERQLERLGDRVDVVASSAWGRFYRDQINSFTSNPQSVWRDLESSNWLVEAWQLAQPMTQPGMFLIPRPLLEAAGGWDETLTLIDDFEFFARVLCHAKEVRFTPSARLYYRSGISSSLSRQSSRRAFESAYHSLIKGTSYLLQKRDDPEAKRSCANLFQSYVYDAFPRHMDLIRLMERRIEALGGSDLKMPAGPRLALLSSFLGWRNAKRLRALVTRY